MISFVYFFFRKQDLIHHRPRLFSSVIVVVSYTFLKTADENDYLDWNSRQALSYLG